MKLLKLTKEDAASFLLYHITGGPKLELCQLMGELTDKSAIFEMLRGRYGIRVMKGERIYELVNRKQKKEENITTYADSILRLWLNINRM